MSADPKRIVATESRCEACSVHIVRVHHENFPEMRVEETTAELAAAYLANRLAAAHDTVTDTAHREAIRDAVTDTQAFLDGNRPAYPGRDAPRTQP